MIWPRPPPPASAASGIVATTWTIVVRRPAARYGTASGSSTRPTTRPPPMPIPRAASVTAGSTPRTPVNVVDSSTGNAKTAAAMTVAVSPNRPAVARMMMIASVGRARVVLAATMTVAAPRWRRWLCPSQMPSGIATTDASSTAASVMSRCSRVRAQMPPGPDQLSGSLSQVIASSMTFMRPSHAATASAHARPATAARPGPARAGGTGRSPS